MRPVPRPSPPEIANLLSQLLDDAVRTIDSGASRELVARQIRGYVLRHHAALASLGVSCPADLADLVVRVDEPCGHPLSRHVTLDFAATPLRGLFA